MKTYTLIFATSKTKATLVCEAESPVVAAIQGAVDVALRAGFKCPNEAGVECLGVFEGEHLNLVSEVDRVLVRMRELESTDHEIVSH